MRAAASRWICMHVAPSSAEDAAQQIMSSIYGDDGLGLA
jgi:hypothetical protein